MRHVLSLAVLIFALLPVPGGRAACPADAGCRGAGAAGSAKERPKRFEPYDPARVRSGSRAGFVDVGGGTEIRVGGRTRVEYNYTR